MADIKKTIEAISKNVSGKNRFKVEMEIPDFVLGVSPNIIQSIPYYIRDVSLPSKAMTVHEGRIMGNIRHTVLNTNMDNVTITFIDSEDMKLHRSMKFFTDSISDDAYNQRKRYYPDDYMMSIFITINDKARYELTGCFPINVGDVQLSNDSQDELLTFSVTFNVHKMYRRLIGE